MTDPFAGGLPTLDGARVRLRAITEADEPALRAVFGDAHHLRFWSHGPLLTADDARKYREGIDAGTRDRTLFQWAITAPPSDDLVGTVTITSWDRDNRRVEIGFILRPDQTGRGIATDAVRTALSFAVDQMAVHRVEADVDPENAGSIRLLEGLGFAYEGLLRDRWFTFFEEWKDSAIYGLLAPDLVR